MIEEWFVNKGTYKEGIALLAQTGKSKAIYSKLCNKPNTPRNMAALKYELNKYRYLKLTNVPVKVTPKSSNSITPISLANKRVKFENAKVTMAMLVDPSIRKRFVEKNHAFYKKWELKKQLNELLPSDEQKALDIIMDIMRLTSLIDTIWREIDYYLVHGQCMPQIDNNYKGLNTDQLRNERQKLYQKRTKRNATLEKWKDQLDLVADNKRLALQSKIDKQQQTITTINLNIEKLNTLIDG